MKGPSRDDLSAHWSEIGDPDEDGDIGHALTPSAAAHQPWASTSAYAASAEAFELTPDGHLRDIDDVPAQPAYEDGDTIDWRAAETAEARRQAYMRARPGWRGALFPTADATRMWAVLILTGVFLGVVGAWLDVLVKWLGDLREGRCAYGIFYNQVACCTGIDAGEVCHEWQSWSQYLHVRSIIGQSLLQAFVYIALAVAFAGAAAVLVVTYAPHAFHTGIPEVVALLDGLVLDAFLGPWTLLVKALAVALAVASGLSLGKEGPLVHIACCAADLFARLVPEIRGNEARKRKLLAAAAAAGVSVAFGSPLGGVLFGLEELGRFADEAGTMWRAFVTSVLAAVALQYLDPFGTARLVLFQATAASDAWRAFELVPWTLLGVIGGLLGSLLIKVNVRIAVYRKRELSEWPVLEVIAVAAITAALSYLVVFLRVPASELVAALFQECDLSKGDYHGLCNPTALWRNVFLLLLAAACKFALTAWTFGTMVPAGIFLPSIAIGACVGRAVGLLTQGLHRAYPALPAFTQCPPDPTVPCISPGFYAVVGAAAMLGGVTRMTISLVVIMFELTGALSHVLPIMISVLVSKWTGDALGRAGVYAAWIAARAYPALPRDARPDGGEAAGARMRPVRECVLLVEDTHELEDVRDMCARYAFEGFPLVTEGGHLLGYVERRRLREAVDQLLAREPDAGSRRCFFAARRDPGAGGVRLAGVLNAHVLALRPLVPLELAVGLLQRMHARHVFFTERGRLRGMLAKGDVAELLARDVPFAGALRRDLKRGEAGL